MIPPNEQRLLDLQAKVFAAIGQPVRLSIVKLLSDGEMCVCDIAEYVGAERSNVSRHLSVLQNAGVVEVRKDGLRMIYRLKVPCLLKSLSCVTEVIRRNAHEASWVLEQI